MNWYPAEWSDDPQEEAAYHEGYELSVTPREEGGFLWMVKATSMVSEWPEVVNANTEDTVAKAKAQAEACATRARKRFLKNHPEGRILL